MTPKAEYVLSLIANTSGEYVFPRISNQVFNKALKLLSDEAGFQKNITSHVARHTAATTLVRSGVSLDVVAKILGHSDTAITLIYAKYEETVLINAMKRVI